MNNAVFSLKQYIFDQVTIDLSHLDKNSPLSLDINPSGTYNPQTGEYDLSFLFQVMQGQDNENQIVSIRCVAQFIFATPVSPEEFPAMFYANSIAILFPYVRAFVSTVTLQANIIPPIIIPTLNLTSLEGQLRKNTTIK